MYVLRKFGGIYSGNYAGCHLIHIWARICFFVFFPPASLIPDCASLIPMRSGCHVQALSTGSEKKRQRQYLSPLASIWLYNWVCTLHFLFTPLHLCLCAMRAPETTLQQQVGFIIDATLLALKRNVNVLEIFTQNCVFISQGMQRNVLSRQ